MQSQSALNPFESQDVLAKTKLFLQKHFFTLIALLTFFLLITAQTMWSAIHGDGAVYAWVSKEMALGGMFANKLPSWDQSQVFAEHPYLFFYFASFFVKLFGVSDIALKLPNFVIASLSIFTVVKASLLKWPAHSKEEGKGRQVGLIAGYALLLNATYIMQVSQPSLDPMAQLLSVVAILVFLFGGSVFLSGLVLGAAFLTKGLELLPNLAAFGIVAIYVYKSSFKEFLKNAGIFLAGLLLPVVAWLAFDYLVWNGQWLNTYWDRQFVKRFFNSNNVNRAFDFAYLMTVARVYFIEFFILGVWFAATDAWKKKKQDPLFLYFVAYCVFNIAAFLIIKKDSSQHATGILVVGSIFVGEAVWDIWNKLGAKRLWVVPVSLLVLTFTYWSWFFINADYNPDMWTVVKNESQVYKGATPLPVVVRDWTGEAYGLFHTAQWYTKSDKVFYQADADRLLIGQEVLMLFEKENGQLVTARVIYKKGLF